MVTVNSDGKRGNNMSEKIESQTVTMAHGAGGKQTSELIDKVFAAHFANPDLTADDAAVLNPPVGKMAVSTDGFILSPAFFLHSIKKQVWIRKPTLMAMRMWQ